MVNSKELKGYVNKFLSASIKLKDLYVNRFLEQGRFKINNRIYINDKGNITIENIDNIKFSLGELIEWLSKNGIYLNGIIPLLKTISNQPEHEKVSYQEHLIIYTVKDFDNYLDNLIKAFTHYNKIA